MSKEKDFPNIAGLLNYGPFMSESRKRLIIEYSLSVLLSLFPMIVCLVMFSIEQAENPSPILDFISLLILPIICFSLAPILILTLLIKNEKLREKVFLWLEDAIETDAFSKKIDVKRNFVGVPHIKIQVDFEIDGIHYTRVSKYDQCKKKNPVDGYHFMWTKYADRKIKILYSPKYDQVMVLKDK